MREYFSNIFPHPHHSGCVGENSKVRARGDIKEKYFIIMSVREARGEMLGKGWTQGADIKEIETFLPMMTVVGGNIR